MNSYSVCYALYYYIELLLGTYIYNFHFHYVSVAEAAVTKSSVWPVRSRSHSVAFR